MTVLWFPVGGTGAETVEVRYLMRLYHNACQILWKKLLKERVSAFRTDIGVHAGVKIALISLLMS